MKDRQHDDAMAELFARDPSQAAELLLAIEADGDKEELAIFRRQLAKALKVASNINTVESLHTLILADN